MIPTLLDPQIALEILIPESLFRHLQTVLDTYPTESLDDLTRKALLAYLAGLPQT